MRILAISGSLRAASTNSSLVRAITVLAPATMQVTLYEGLGELPHFSPDIDGDDAPAPVAALRRLLGEADGVLICTPEYAHGMPGSLKNLLDWTVSSGDFADKPVAALSASPYATGGEMAHASLLTTLKMLSATVPEGATLSIPFVRSSLDADGAIADEATARSLRGVLDALATAIAARRD